jgi:KDO2-lipid IV(A) lauroyltransferase
MGGFLSHAGVAFMRLLCALPLPLLRAMGAVFGRVLHLLARSRVQVVRVNLQLCFPKQSAQERSAWEKQIFVRFAQAWLDRSWLWHASEAVVRTRLKINDDGLGAFESKEPLIWFAPHFFGLDAGWTAMNFAAMDSRRTMSTIYSAQSDPVVDAWILAGRKRFGQPSILARTEGPRPVAQALKRNEPLYLLPDMDLTGAAEAHFVPFFAATAATIGSLHRFAKLGRAKVRMLHVRMTPGGYDIDLGPVWQDFPTADVVADTERMNRELEALILKTPDQYWWVHKRFKSRPVGEPSVY